MDELTKVYEQNAEQVFKYLMVLCRNVDIAEELTQETFYQAVRSIDTYNGECKMSVWRPLPLSEIPSNPPYIRVLFANNI